MNGEEWKQHISGLCVSNLGRVWWTSRTYPNGHFTYGWENGHGYLQVTYQGKQYIVHRLVAECFIENQENKPHIDHINRNRKDNRVENLRWVTASENNYNREIPKNNALSKTVFQYTLSGELVKTWKSTKECGRNGFSKSAVVDCCNLKYHREGNNVYKGYIWSYSLLTPEPYTVNELSLW